MRDNFYHWQTLALVFAIQFGGAVQRAADGHVIWSELVAFWVAGILATYGVVDHYRMRQQGREQDRKDNP